MIACGVYMFLMITMLCGYVLNDYNCCVDILWMITRLCGHVMNDYHVVWTCYEWLPCYMYMLWMITMLYGHIMNDYHVVWTSHEWLPCCVDMLWMITMLYNHVMNDNHVVWTCYEWLPRCVDMLWIITTLCGHVMNDDPNIQQTGMPPGRDEANIVRTDSQVFRKVLMLGRHCTPFSVCPIQTIANYCSCVSNTHSILSHNFLFNKCFW